VIPDEAVEAGLAAHLSFKNQRSMDNSANLIRRILEAAAPHLMAAAWDEGYDFCLGIVPDGVTGNPYRKPTDAV